ncbi:dihydroorotate dehydrogenase-like protein [Sulfurimonas aquatica]|uniref:Dihydroorotate dehydrogenase-like protein n=1 Tax=Sulfurimonas aquatica TaxID=2672570 RepID=A0A975B1T1_9BACT|nr:dihydroorotate dehydrogenase-like protein [Sulfurimonas aquatica]QSZ42671.1 dihydroorotate dehydrogenase-like protein [Sulfurimonas aquatica]
MDLSTTYMGLKLKNPIIIGASPLTATIESIKKLEENGAAAVVLHSIFEEQINHETHELDHFMFAGSESYAESLGYFPEVKLSNLESEHYLEELIKLKEEVNIPIIASLNGVSRGGWIEYAKKLEDAGVDALELNITYIPTDLELEGKEIEEMYLDTLKAVRESVSLPVSIKMNAIFSSPANMAKKFTNIGANALVLFDRPVHVDIDLENLNSVQTINPSSSKDLSETLRWSAILYKKVDASICASTGVKNYEDILKAMMSGADAVQMVTTILEHGPIHIKNTLDALTQWMVEKEYVSIEQMKGSISLHHSSNPAAYERASYMRVLTSYRY